MLSPVLTVLASGGFTPPTISDTHLPDIIPWGAEWGTGFGKQMLLIILSIVLIWAFFGLAMRKPTLVPGKAQWLAESAYAFVRDGIAKDIIGEKHYKSWIPFLFAIFFFVLFNNFFGAIPFLQLPSFSHAGAAYAIAIIVYIVWIATGVRHHGIKYFKLAVVPKGVPTWVLFILVPLEILSNFVVRPLTHSLRLMAVMLSGHMILMLAAAGAQFLIMETGNIWLQGTGILVILGYIAMYFLELVLMALQAFVFVLLTAIYVQGAIAANDH